MALLFSSNIRRPEAPEYEEVETLSLMQLSALRLGDIPMPLNPNVTYRELTSPREREILAHITNPEVYANRIADLRKLFAKKYADEGTYDDPKEAAAAAEAAAEAQGQKIKEVAKKISETQVEPYNRPPIPFDRASSFPDYDKYMTGREEFEASLEGSDDAMVRTNAAIQSGRWDLINPNNPRSLPWGYERTQEINKRGFNADPSNQIRFSEDSVENAEKSDDFYSLLNLVPRQITKEQYAHVGKKVGLDGEFLYINPNEPFKFGVGYRPKDSDDVQIVNSPQLSATDWWTVAKEVPSIALDVGATLYAAQKFAGPSGAVTGVAGGAITKVAEILKLSGAAAAGATTGDLIRLMVGKSFDAHTLTWTEMAREAGVVGAWAFGGTAAVTLSAKAIGKAYNIIFNKDVPPELWAELDTLVREAKGIDIPAGMTYGPEITIQEIKDQVEYLVKEFNLPRASFDEILTSGGGKLATNFEVLFLKNADNPRVKKLYGEFLKGNSKVIDNFVEALRKEIGPSIDQPADAIPADLTKSMRKLLQQEIDRFEATVEGVILGVGQKRVGVDEVIPAGGGVDEVIPAGGGILGKIARPDISSKTYPRTQRQIKQAVDEFKETVDAPWRTALKNPEYEELTTGAGKTTAPTQTWMNANSKSLNDIFADPQGKGALDDLVKLAGDVDEVGSSVVLNKLRGRNPQGQFENPQFTLEELNTARVEINRYQHSLRPDQKRAFAAAAKLQRGLEQQVDVLIRDGASLKAMKELGLKKPLNEKQLTEWIEKNKYGHDLSDAYAAQLKAYELIKTDLIQTLLNTTRPEKVAEIIFASTAKGTGENTVVQNLMTVLKDSPEEVFQLQKGLAAYIRRDVLEKRGNPFQKASNYQDFIKEHEGVLKEVYGKRNKDGVLDLTNPEFKILFQDSRAFQKNVLDPIEQANVDIKRLQARFGGLALGDPKKPILNIVQNILREGERIPLIESTEELAKATANLLDDAQYLKQLADKNPTIRKQIAQVFKRDLLTDILSPRGAGFGVDPVKLNRLLTEGFGPEQISGPRLTFESLVLPMLGREDGKAFVKNMRHLNSVVQRVTGVGRSDAVKEGIKSLEKSNVFFRVLQRLWLSPISVGSRRTSVMINTASSRTNSFVGRMIVEPELFERSMAWARGKESLQKFITMLAAHSSVEARDLGNELKYYDRLNKEQTKDKQNITTNPIEPSVRPNIPDRVLQLYQDTWGWGSDKAGDVFDDILEYFKDDEDIYDDEDNIIEEPS